MDNLIELTKEDREEILEKIEEVKNIREDVSDEVKRIIDDFIEKSEILFDNEKIKLDVFEQMISDLNNISSNFAEIEFAVYGLNEIKTRIANKPDETGVSFTPIFRRPQYMQQQDNIDDSETAEENTEMLRSSIKQVKRPVIVSIKTKPTSEKNEVYSYLYRIERHVHLYSVTRNRENFDKIGALLESLKAIPVIGPFSQIIHSIKSAADLINNLKEKGVDEEEPETPERTEEKMREIIRTRYHPKLYKILHALSRMSETGDYATYSDLARYARCETSWSRDVINRIERSRLIRINRRRSPHRIIASEYASFTRLAKYWQRSGRYK